MDDGRYTLAEFVDLIDDEGGIYSLLEDGVPIRDYDLPKDVQDQWAEITDLFRDMSDLVSDFWLLVNKHMED